MFTHKFFLHVFVIQIILFGSITCPAGSEKTTSVKKGPNLGKPASDEMIKSWDQSIFPDGSGLPVGQGTVTEGKEIFKADCAICHGPAGIGGTAEELSGGEGGLTSEYPDKTIGTYWPYATTIFDFIKRSMPLSAPGSLSDDQTYAVTAYLLYVNNIIPEDAVISNETLANVKMPNRDGFIWIYPGLKKSGSSPGD